MSNETDYFKQWMDEQTKIRRLLLVDDSMEDSMLIQRYTYPYHCEWVMANSFKNAEYALQKMDALGGFSLIFLDLNLNGSPGDQGGVTAFRKIKEKYPEIPVVILSGYLSTLSISEITKYGFAMFAQKPESFSDKYFKELFRIMNIPFRPKWMGDRSSQSEPDSP